MLFGNIYLLKDIEIMCSSYDKETGIAKFIKLPEDINGPEYEFRCYFSGTDMFVQFNGELVKLIPSKYEMYHWYEIKRYNNITNTFNETDACALLVNKRKNIFEFKIENRPYTLSNNELCKELKLDYSISSLKFEIKVYDDTTKIPLIHNDEYSYYIMLEQI